MKYAMPLSSETSGQLLPVESYNDLYTEIVDEGHRYFWRMNSNQVVELVVVFEDIEDFDRSLETGVAIDFQTYKDRFLLIVWTNPDPTNPLGFPISFRKNENDDRAAVQQIMDQSEIEIHYLTLLDDELLHIYSQTLDITEEEKAAAKKIYDQEPLAEVEETDDSEFIGITSDLLLDHDLCASGYGYLLDYSSLVQKNGEEQAKEKLMSAIISAMKLAKRHPRADVRDSSFIIWAAERREFRQGGEESVLMEIYMTPPLVQIFDMINDDQLMENPLSTILLSMTEFLRTIEARPIDQGAYPILHYGDKTISYIEPDELLQQRLASLSERIPNPYLNEGDVAVDGEA